MYNTGTILTIIGGILSCISFFIEDKNGLLFRLAAQFFLGGLSLLAINVNCKINEIENKLEVISKKKLKK